MYNKHFINNNFRLRERTKEIAKQGCIYKLNIYTSHKIKISKIMKELGVSVKRKGYHYIREAILIVINDETSIQKIKENIYCKIAPEYNTSSEAVERAIRTAIESMIKDGNIKAIYEMFGYAITPKKGKPTNKEFIATIADKIKLDMGGKTLYRVKKLA